MTLFIEDIWANVCAIGPHDGPDVRLDPDFAKEVEVFDRLEDAVEFYTTENFSNSPSGQFLASINAPVDLDAREITSVAAFLRAINALENIRSARACVEQAGELTPRKDDQVLSLGTTEIRDAADVLSEAGAENRLARRPGWPIVSAEYLATTPVDVLVLPSSPATRPGARASRSAR